LLNHHFFELGVGICKKHAMDKILCQRIHTTPAPLQVLHVLGTVPGGTPLPSATNIFEVWDKQASTNWKGLSVEVATHTASST
jgi:hypothetical protein